VIYYSEQLFKRHLNNLIFDAELIFLVGVGELEDMGAGRTAIADMSSSSVTVAVDAVGLAALPRNATKIMPQCSLRHNM